MQVFYDDDVNDGDEKKAKKKPTVEVDITCPACRAQVHVKAYKRRTSEPVTPEYQVSAEVELGK